jgi:hypothetical protein
MSSSTQKTHLNSTNQLVMADDWLDLALEAGKSVGWDWDVKRGTDTWFGDLQTIFGIPMKTFVGRVEDFHQRVHPTTGFW